MLKEPSGTLGSRIQEMMFTAINIFIMTSKSDILTSNHFETWEVYFPNVGNVGPNSIFTVRFGWTDDCPDIIQRNRPDSAKDIVLLTILALLTILEQQEKYNC